MESIDRLAISCLLDRYIYTCLSFFWQHNTLAEVVTPNQFIILSGLAVEINF